MSLFRVTCLQQLYQSLTDTFSIHFQKIMLFLVTKANPINVKSLHKSSKQFPLYKTTYNWDPKQNRVVKMSSKYEIPQNDNVMFCSRDSLHNKRSFNPVSVYAYTHDCNIAIKSNLWTLNISLWDTISTISPY